MRPGQCAELPDDIWLQIIKVIEVANGLRAAKVLRKTARVSRIFAHVARTHPDNICA